LSLRRTSYDLAIDNAAHHARRKVVAFLGILIVLFNIVGGFSKGLAGDNSSPALTDLTGDLIVICTGAGMIVVDRDGKPVDPGSGGLPEICPFCLPLAHGAVAAPAAPVLSMPILTGSVDVSMPKEAASPKCVRLANAHSPRGPPRA
jgi:hypothetical protein